MLIKQAQKAMNQGLSRVLLGLLWLYRYLLSPWLGRNCRFEPSCSQYAVEAIQIHGPGFGAYLALKRVIRCAPWSRGGYDPVPAHVSHGDHTVTNTQHTCCSPSSDTKKK